MLRQPRIGAKQGQGLSVNLIVIVAIALLILIIVSIMVMRSGRTFSQSTGEDSCLAARGVCRDSGYPKSGEVPASPNPQRDCSDGQLCYVYDFTK